MLLFLKTTVTLQESINFAIKFTFVNNTQERIDMLNAEIDIFLQDILL